MDEFELPISTNDIIQVDGRPSTLKLAYKPH